MSNQYTRPALFCGIVAAGVACALAIGHLAADASGGPNFDDLSCSSPQACLQWTNSIGDAIIGISVKANGIAGLSQFKNGSGLFGKNTTSTGTGVSGIATTGTGVAGTATSGSGIIGSATSGTGVKGLTSTGNAGVYGATNNQSATTKQISHAIEGIDLSTDGGTQNTGVYATSDFGTGVLASTGSGNAIEGLSNSGAGVFAESFSRFALVAVAGPGNVQVPVLVASGVQGNAAADVIEAFDSGGTELMRLDDVGDISISGLMYTAGLCNSGCAKRGPSERRVVRYAPQESLPTMEDTGEAQLVDGQAYVRIDSALANVIDGNSRYLVFITPQGETAGDLYVSNKTAGGFQVRENRGGRSTIAFDYRIVAKPVGATRVRLPMVALRESPQPLPTHRPQR